MVTDWFLHQMTGLIQWMVSILPAWTYQIQAVGWVSAFIGWLYTYQYFVPIGDALLPVLGLHWLFYTIVMTVQIVMRVMALVRGGSGG